MTITGQRRAQKMSSNPRSDDLSSNLWQPASGGSARLLWLGLIVTVLWLVLGLDYIFGSMGWTEFSGLAADQLGGFLEGSFAPLAFLWLVIGYFLQREELRQNTEALRAQSREIQLSVEQLMIQSEKMAQTELHSRQRTFLQIVDRVYSQLGTISGLLFTSSQGVTGKGLVTQEEIGEMFRRLSTRDTEVFSRRLLEALFPLNDERERYDLFYGTAVRARHSNNFIHTFERMLQRAAEVDTDTMIRDSVAASTHAFVYEHARKYQDMAPPELADHEKTGISIQLIR
jgi:hypothetical protein